jgi:hypothetical protein
VPADWSDAGRFDFRSRDRAAAADQALTDQVQYRIGSREYCWYDDGWQGPGFYWCGYRLRVGYGWGGPAGWHGWRVGGGEFRERERIGAEGRPTLVAGALLSNADASASRNAGGSTSNAAAMPA